MAQATFPVGSVIGLQKDTGMRARVTARDGIRHDLMVIQGDGSFVVDTRYERQCLTAGWWIMYEPGDDDPNGRT